MRLRGKQDNRNNRETQRSAHTMQEGDSGRQYEVEVNASVSGGVA